jgi:beta-aspartyl-peptidase (threonine type)
VLPRQRFPSDLADALLAELHRCLAEGWAVLNDGGPAVEAVCACVAALENVPWFNAGHGAVLNADGRVECDAAVMAGDGRCGAVAGIRSVRQPVQLARRLLDEPGLVFLAGAGAEAYARRQGFEAVDESYFITVQRQQELAQAREAGTVSLDTAERFGTVGAVACDRQGRLAAATSTGGLTNKVPGRIGDSPVIGAGTYARDDSCAVSCTGMGEVFLRQVVAHDIAARLRYGGQSLKEAVEAVVLTELPALGGEGGLIAVTPAGELVLSHNSPSLYRAWQREGEPSQAAIF